MQYEWPEDKQKIYGPTAKCWRERRNLPFHDSLLLRRRLVISSTIKPEILMRLHDGHQGLTNTCENGASLVWWHGITQHIATVVQNCPMCEKYHKERIKPMKGWN